MTDQDAQALPSPRRGARRTALAAGAAGIAALFAVVALRHNPAPAAVPPPFTVEGARVDIREGAATWSYLEFAEAALQPPLPAAPVPGRVVFDEARAEPVEAPLPGRVDSVAVKLGERVASGDRLLAIRSPELVDLRKEIEELKGAEAARSKTYERLRSLVALAAEPEKKLIDAEHELKQAQLARAGAEAKLRSLLVDAASEGLYWLTAPRAGVVVERDVLAGQQVGPDRSEPLLVIAELDELIVNAHVPESRVRELRVGQPAQILPATASASPMAGTVEYVGEVVDPQRRMVDVRVRVPNPGRELRPNAFAQVAFAPEDAPRVVVAAEAVVTDDQQSFVFVRPAGANALERRAVTVGRQHGGKIEIADGLAPGETYVTKGALLLLNAVDLASQ